MRRQVRTTITLEAADSARLTVAVAVAEGAGIIDEFRVAQAGRSLPFVTHADLHGGRLHVVDVGSGAVQVDYVATIEGTARPLPVEPIDEIRYLRPSRYCESDSLLPIAVAEFGGLDETALLTAVPSWVGVRVAYVPGSSLPTDGAVSTLLARRGVCRDFAHLVVGFLRALGVPARVVSVYAPGLSPMDFHAVAEVAVGGVWHVVDATARAPRGSLVRIATGRDAADTAFLSVQGAPVRLVDLAVSAVVDALPDDDLDRSAVLQ
jgi:transglutaminase-like putative cysteine protease